LFVTSWASILHSTLKHSIFLHRLYKSSSNLEVGFSKSQSRSSELESHPWVNWDLNTFLLRKSTIKYPLNLKSLNTWTWLVPNNFIWFVIIKTKLEDVPLGQQECPSKCSEAKWLWTLYTTKSIHPFFVWQLLAL